MLVTLFGIVILTSLGQSENDKFPMLVTRLGIVMLVRLLQPENALAPILVTLPSVGMILLLHPAIRIFSLVFIRQFPAE